MVSHGSSFVTADLDICYARNAKNFEALVRSLGPLHPRLRGVPKDLPFHFDSRTLKAGLNFTLSTNAGDVDLLGEIMGVGGFESILKGSMEFDLYGDSIRVMGLDDLIRAKKAAGRDKDRIHLKELLEIKRRRTES